MDESEPADPRASRPRDEPVAFAPVRVESRRGRRRSLLALAGWVLVIGAVVAVGTFGRNGRQPGPSAAAIVPSLAVVTPAADAPSGAGDAIGPSAPAGSEPSSASNALAVALAPDRGAVDVTGSLLVRGVVRVLVSVQDEHGRVLTWRSLAIGPGVGGIRPEHWGAFLLQIALPMTARAGWLTFEVTAYNALGTEVTSVREQLGPPRSVCGSGRDCHSS